MLSTNFLPSVLSIKMTHVPEKHDLSQMKIAKAKSSLFILHSLVSPLVHLDP